MSGLETSNIPSLKALIAVLIEEFKGDVQLENIESVQRVLSTKL